MANMLQDNDSQKALEYYEQALSIVENSVPPDNQTAFYCLSGMGRLHNKNNMLEDALRCNLKAIEFHRRVLSPDHTHLGDLLKNIGFCYRNMHNTQQALHYFNESLVIYRVNYEPEHEKIKKLEAQIAKLSRNRNTTVNTRTTRVTASERTSNAPSSNSHSRISQQTSTSMTESSSEVKETLASLNLRGNEIGTQGAQYLDDVPKRVTNNRPTNETIDSSEFTETIGSYLIRLPKYSHRSSGGFICEIFISLYSQFIKIFFFLSYDYYWHYYRWVPSRITAQFLIE
ncbi:unnamed protein product [Rotaria sordida]|uniref:Kinesin light chain n=1 Tax=Rotaria sordida TaxID=392033 RepID=A0A814AZ22_9BILA|nr:unnamed protein product [Rotaria sordida]CAF3866028.1 unnamed protein product [Rotaria sordida]